MEHTLKRYPWLLPLVLAALTVILLRPVILPPHAGQVLNGKDLIDMFYPLQQYIEQTVKDGELPLWNPRTFIGHPVTGNPHSALFYPATWLLWLVGVQRGMGWMLALHTWIGAWGMARLMRSFRASQLGSLLAGVVFAMSGWAGAHYYPGHYNLLLVYAWIPWALAAYRYALARGIWWAVLPGIGVLGAALLAGYPPLVLYTGFGLLALWAYHIARADDLLQGGLYATLRLAAMGTGGLVLGAALVLPAVELTGLSAREAGDLAFANTHALPPAQLLSFIVPGLFGNPTAEPYFYWGADFFEEFLGYAGLLPLLAVPLLIRRGQRDAWPFVGLVAFGLALSLGLDGAIMPLLVRWVPGFGYFRVPARALLLVVIGLAGLTALLVTRLQRDRPADRALLLRPALRAVLPAFV
ncbi:MAG: hypothetical protein JXJ20_11625, partial [Anaerolineae bacterium]|nr:hypothetical protein [Anaerolineae bacterium]